MARLVGSWRGSGDIAWDMAGFLGRGSLGGKILRQPRFDIPAWLRTVVGAGLEIGGEIFARIDFVQKQGFMRAASSSTNGAGSARSGAGTHPRASRALLSE